MWGFLPKSGINPPPREPAPRLGRLRANFYFLWRCRLRSLRCLCLRIFFRRFFTTLPTVSPMSLKTLCGSALRGFKLDVNPSSRPSLACNLTEGSLRRPETGCGRRMDTGS